MKSTKSFLLGLVFLFGISPTLQAQCSFPWEYRSLEYFDGDYEAFMYANFFTSGFPTEIPMGQWVEYMEKNTPPTYFVISRSVDQFNEAIIVEIMLFFHPLELIKQYVHEERYFLTVHFMFRSAIFPSNPKFDELVKIGVNRLLPWEEYKKHEDVLKDIIINNPWVMEGEYYTPEYLANTPD